MKKQEIENALRDAGFVYADEEETEAAKIMRDGKCIEDTAKLSMMAAFLGDESLKELGYEVEREHCTKIRYDNKDIEATAIMTVKGDECPSIVLIAGRQYHATSISEFQDALADYSERQQREAMRNKMFAKANALAKAAIN